MRVRRLAAALAGLSVLAAGCAATTHGTAVALHTETPTTVKHPTVSQFDEQAAQTFLIDGPAPTAWNPHVEGAVEDGSVSVLDEILGPVLPSVFEVKPNFGVVLNTALVTSARQTKPFPQTIVYQINPQATWSDGTPITYQDFVYNWKSEEAGSYCTASFLPAGPLPLADDAGYEQITSVTEVHGNPYRVKVVFSSPDPDWRSLFSLMLPAHLASTAGSVGFTDPTDDLSGGPFEVQSSVPGVSVTLVRNPRYWGAPAHLAQVTFRFAADPAEILPSFQQADVDATEVVPTAGLDAGLAKVKGLETTEYAGPQWEQLELNQSGGSPLSDLALRQAILLAVNRTQLIAATIGKSDPSVRPLDSMLFVPGQPGYADDAGVYATSDVAGAEAVLDAAGYTYRGSTLLKGGKPVVLEITSTSGDPLLQAEERFVVKALRQIGITVHEHDVTDLPQTIAAGHYQLAISTETASPYLSLEADRYESAPSMVATPSSVGTSERELNAAIADAAATVGTKARVAAYRALDRRLWSDAVALPLFQLPELLAYDKTYVNMGPNPAPGGPTWDMALWGVPAPS